MGREGGESATKVLVVDDDPGYADLLASRLEEAAPRFDPTTETDPHVALDLAAERRFDCVLCDYEMPDVTGIEFAATLREMDLEVPVVLVTGHGSERIAADAIRYGVVDYRRKGEDDDPTHLAESVERAIDRRDGVASRTHDRDTVARMIRHDLRNPLAVAKGWLEMADAEGKPIDRAREALDRMEEILDDFGRLAETDTEVSREAVDLSAVTTAAWEMVDPEDAKLQAEYGTRIRADPSMLQAVLENLVDNADTHGGPDVTIEVGRLDHEDGFFVADDGRGIPPAERDRVFERGYTGGDGTGMGLAIVDAIAEAHGWTVTLAESDSGGACFEFRGVELADRE